jgi:putative hydrolase of HD superfamily
MHKKAQNPIISLGEQSVSPIIESYFQINHLKHIYRQGWLTRGLSKVICESVAEHTFGVAILALILVDTYFPELDRTKVIIMALVHDLGEVYAGDILPNGLTSLNEKHKLEHKSISQVLSNTIHWDEYREIWCEYETGKSPEAIFVRQIDRLEMALQASVYEHQGNIDLSEFFQSAKNDITNSTILRILEELENLR